MWSLSVPSFVVFVRAASERDGLIIRGPFGRHLGLSMQAVYGPISVYEDSTLEILIPDVRRMDSDLKAARTPV